MEQMQTHGQMNPYARFAAMVGASTVVMFGLMYLNTYEADHISFSQTRAWMALVMGATMAVIMLAFMTHMLENKRANVAIVVGSVLVFAVSLWLVRSQVTVDDASYMKAMIPHHSIAIMTSKRANITDAGAAGPPTGGGAQAGRRHHRSAGSRDCRDEELHRRPAGQEVAPRGFAVSLREAAAKPRLTSR